MNRAVAVFFDIGDTLASAVVQSGHLERLEVYPFVADVLARLRSGGGEGSIAVGLISNTGQETAEHLEAVLTAAGLTDLLDSHLCLFSSVEGMNKSHPEIFALAVTRAGLTADRCVFVGDDCTERDTAKSVGMQTSPNPLHVLHLVEGGLVIPAPPA